MSIDKYCYKCSIPLHFMNRKLYCYHCKHLFCYTCLEYKKKLINEEKKTICYQCYIYKSELKELKDIIAIFNLLPITLKEYYTISCVCSSWYKIYNNYSNKLLSLYNKLPYYKLNKLNINILYSNKNYIYGHNKYIVKLLQSISNKKITTTLETTIIHILKGKKKISCKTMKCLHTCKPTLSVLQIIQCLYFNLHSHKIVTILINMLSSTNNIYSSHMSNYIFIFVYILHYYKYNTPILNIFLEFLYNESNKDIHFCNILFWDLTYNIKNILHAQFYANIRKKLVNSIDKKKYNILLNSHDFTKNLIELIKNEPDNSTVSQNIHYHLLNNEYKINEYLYIPINLNKQIISIDSKNIKVLQSKTKPIVIPCCYIKNNTKQTYNFMIKPEDLRKEYIIMNIIKIIDTILKTELDLDLHIITYNILPISEKFGFIEFISNASTIYDIKEEKKFSIQNFIIEKNPNITAHEMRNNFSKSCAAYCVITYLLGIGDRHLENIMITKEGYLFNIDFGYILGLDPKLLSPKFRLTNEMIDAMGGSNSKYFHTFKQYCTTAFNCLRKHVDIFYILISQLTTIILQNTDKKYDLEYIKNYINKRFIPNKPNFNASIEFKYIILKNSNTYSGSMIDFFHKKYKKISSNRSKSSKEIKYDDIDSDDDNEQDTNSSLYTSAVQVFSGAQSSFKKMFSS